MDDADCGGALLGLAETAALLGLNRPALSGRIARGDFPRAVAQQACGPIWRVEQIVEYAVRRANEFHEREGVIALAERSGSLVAPVLVVTGDRRGPLADGAGGGAAPGSRPAEMLRLLERCSPPVPVHREGDDRRPHGRIVTLDPAWLGWIARHLGERRVEHA